MTTKQALSELKQLGKAAAENLYRRIELATTVLEDLDWIAKVHDGSDLKAQDALQSEFFRDLGGFITLGKLVAMYRHVPKEQWSESRYDVAAVEVVYDDQAQPKQKERGTRTAWKRTAAERLEKLEVAERQVKLLQDKVEQLQREKDRLHGRVEQLERLLQRETAAAA